MQRSIRIGRYLSFAFSLLIPTVSTCICTACIHSATRLIANVRIGSARTGSERLIRSSENGSFLFRSLCSTSRATCAVNSAPSVPAPLPDPPFSHARVLLNQGLMSLFDVLAVPPLPRMYSSWLRKMKCFRNIGAALTSRPDASLVPSRLPVCFPSGKDAR